MYWVRSKCTSSPFHIALCASPDGKGRCLDFPSMHETQSTALEVLIFMPSTINWTCFTEAMLRWLKQVQILCIVHIQLICLCQDVQKDPFDIVSAPI